MSRRTDLHHKLEAILGSRNVYFQPPTGLRMEYPCVVYHLDDANDIHANNKIYRRLYRYTMTYITKDPDDPKRDLFDDMQYCAFNRFFTSDNLNHFVYTIYA
jgi:hypothetical protein